MKKLFLTLIFCIGILSPYKVCADFEPVHLVQEAVKFFDEGAQKVQTVQQTRESINNMIAQGPLGKATSALNKLKSRIKKPWVKKNTNKQPEAIAKGCAENDASKCEEAQKATVASYTDENQIDTAQINEANQEEILRNNLAQMYAYAFARRIQMAESRDKEPEDAEDLSDDLRPSMLLREILTDNLEKINNIVLMTSQMYELKYRLKMRTMFVKAEDEDN